MRYLALQHKTPYKREQALRFPYEGRGTRECAGFRIGVSARGVTLVGGAYAPGSAALRAIRRRIAEDPGDLERILRRKALREAMGPLRGHRTLRVPIGYDPDHPAGDLLRHRQLHLEATLPARMATDRKLEKELLRRMKLMTPFVDLLNEAIDDG